MIPIAILAVWSTIVIAVVGLCLAARRGDVDACAADGPARHDEWTRVALDTDAADIAALDHRPRTAVPAGAGDLAHAA